MAQHKTGQTPVDPYYTQGPFLLGNLGVDSYNPPVASQALAYLRLNNVEPRLGRLVSSLGYADFQASFLGINDAIYGFGSYEHNDRVHADLYAFSSTSIYRFNFATGQFNTTPIFTGFPASTLPYVVLPWFDVLYVTKLGGPYVALTGPVATIVPNAPSARYGILANFHGFLAATNDSTSDFQNYLSRVRWSDLDDPSSWVLNPDSSEADFYDLQPDSRQIKGLSYQRGMAVSYAENGIWTSTYSPSSSGPGTFSTTPLFPGLGCIFHDSVVTFKQVDYFIGEDGFYTLNGLQATQMATNMFERFINDVKLVSNTSVRGYVDKVKHQIFWVYTNKQNQLWSIVYNYIDNTWSERDPLNLQSWFSQSRTILVGYDVIADVDIVIASDDSLIYDPADGYPATVPQLVGNNAIQTTTTDPSQLATSPFTHEIETFDFYFGNFNLKKEVTKVVMEYFGTGSANLTMQIASRDNQGQPLLWCDPVPVDSVVDGSFTFFSRQQGQGKFLRFKFLWNNTSVNFIKDLSLMSFSKVETTAPDENPEK